MYMEIERRKQPQRWESRGPATRKDRIQSFEAAGIKRRAGETARGTVTEFPLSRDETQQILKKLEALTEANAELEAFNATVSHDLCTPLTAINGYCQVLRELCRDQLDDTSKEYLQGIYEGTLRMKELIGSMLNFSRVTHAPCHREKIDLSEVAHAVASELKLAAPQRKVDIRIAKGVTGSGDRGLWRSVLDNLIGNAWKYSAGREKTVIEFGRTTLAGKAVYFVRDNGPGFDMAQADQVFMPFQRISGTGVKGDGIGLATVDRIVRRHGGRIWAESKPGEGASFFFTME